MQQMLMGEGKSTVVAPLLGMLLADGKRLVAQVVPAQLLAQSRAIMWKAFSLLLTKSVRTFTFDRACAEDERSITGPRGLLTKVEDARACGDVLLCSPAAIKSLLLRFIEGPSNPQCTPSWS